MKRREGRWVDVRAGNYVEDKTGKMWRVLRWDYVAAKLIDKDEKEATAHPNPYAKVVYYVRTIEDGLKVLLSAFPGAEVIEERKEE